MPKPTNVYQFTFADDKKHSAVFKTSNDNPPFTSVYVMRAWAESQGVALEEGTKLEVTIKKV